MYLLAVDESTIKPRVNTTLIDQMLLSVFIGPVAVYKCEIRTLLESEQYKCVIFVRKI